eukprot:5119704-Pleurochrysis_carterae.AAC.2
MIYCSGAQAAHAWPPATDSLALVFAPRGLPTPWQAPSATASTAPKLPTEAAASSRFFWHTVTAACAAAGVAVAVIANSAKHNTTFQQARPVNNAQDRKPRPRAPFQRSFVAGSLWSIDEEPEASMPSSRAHTRAESAHLQSDDIDADDCKSGVHSSNECDGVDNAEHQEAYVDCDDDGDSVPEKKRI